MLDRANSGPEPCAEILRAIRHGVAAGACSVAARETGSAYWAGMAVGQREKAKVLLHQATRSDDAPSLGEGLCSSPFNRSIARSRTRTVTLRPE